MKIQSLILSATALACALASLPAYSKQTSPSVKLPCEIPTSGLGQNATQADFDDYSWQVFIALNRPASSSHRGEPNCNVPYNYGTKVWQTYKTSEQVFLEGAQPPGYWNAGYSETNYMQDLTQIAKLKFE